MNYTAIEVPRGGCTITQQIVEAQAKNRAEWVAQLRSGKYPQTKNYLHKEDGYCCLGVMCDIVDTSRWQKSTTIPGVFIFGINFSMPAPNTSFQFGLRRPAGTFRVDRAFLEKFPDTVSAVTTFAVVEGVHIGLPDLNDAGMSFEAIADVIEYAPTDMLLKVGDPWFSS